MDPILEALKRHPRAGPYAELVWHAAGLANVDPLLLAPVVDRESLFGLALDPKGPKGTGDHGNGLGFGQLDRNAHPLVASFRLGKPEDWVRDAEQYPFLWTCPGWNLYHAALKLRLNLDAFAGDHLPAIAAYNASIGRVLAALGALPADAPIAVRVKALDAVTTGRDYVSDVLRRRDEFRSTCLPR